MWLADTHAQQQKSKMCVPACMCLCWMHPFLHIFRFSFPSPKVSPVILAICLFSCHTCLLSFQRSGRQADREREGWKGREKIGNGADYSWLAALCVLWIAYKCKGNTAFLTVWQNERTNAWNDGWVDGCMLLGRER